MANELIIKIGATSKEFDDELKKLGGKTEALEKQLATISKISGIAFAGLTASVGLAVKEFAKFDNSMRGVKTLLDENSFGAKGLEQGFKDMRKEALALGAKLPLDVDKVTKALFDTVSAGVEAGRATEVVAASAKLAVAGLTDVSVATDGMTSAMNAYQLGADAADEVASKFFTAQKFGKTTVEELASGFGLAGAAAQAYGVSMDELFAAVSAATTAGIKTKTAYTSVQALLANIAKPTKEAATEAKRLGIDFSTTALRAKGLEQFLADLTEAQGFTKDSISALFGSVEAQKVAFALTGAQAETFGTVIDELTDKTKALNTVERAFNEQQGSLEQQFVKLKGTVQVALILLGEQFAPLVGELTEEVSELVSAFAQDEELVEFAALILKIGTAVTGLIFAMTTFALVAVKVTRTFQAFNTTFKVTELLLKSNRKLSTAFTKVLGLMTKQVSLGAIAQKAFAVAAAVAQFALKGLRVVMATAFGPIGILITLLGLLAVAFKDEIGQFAVEAWGKLVRAVKIGAEILRLAWENVVDGFEVGVAIVSGSLAAIRTVMQAFAKSAIEIFDGVSELLRGVFTLDLDMIKSGFAKAKDAATKNFGDLGTEAGFAFNSALSKKFAEFDGRGAQDATKVVEDVVKKSNEKQEKDQKGSNQRKLDEETFFQKRLEALKKEGAELAAEAALTGQEQELLAIEERNNRLLELELEYQTAKREAKLTDQEIEAEQEAEFQLRMQEIQNDFRRQELNLDRDLEIEKAEADNKAKIEEMKRQKKQNAELLEEQRKFGKTFVEIQKFFRSENVKNAQEVSGELVGLQRSENSTLKAIGKAAAITQIAIRTAESAMNIFRGFSTIPIIGPALGFAGAAAAVAFGAEQIANVQGARDGGLAMGPGGIPGKDSLPFMLAPGELIAPAQNFNEVVDSVGTQRARQELLDEGELGPGGGAVEVTVGFRDDAFEIIEQKLLERRAIGEGSI